MFKNISKSRKFKIAQIEVTAACNLKCIMCPKGFYKKEWKTGYMDLDTYKKISQCFSSVEYVHLQGWGEPLLHKELFEMTELAKSSGCSVGFTTNGMHLNQSNCKKIVDSGLDIIGISIDGATKETYESIRVGATFEKLLDNIKTLTSVMEESSSDKPKIVFSIVKMKKNIKEVPLLVDMADELNAKKVVATNLDCVSKPLDEELKVFSKKENEEFENILKEAKAKAENYGIEYYSYPLTPQDVPVCGSYPLENVYISWDGYVSPCVNLNLPVNRIRRIFWGEEYEIERTHFGNILEEDLHEIWNKMAYKEFRDYFKRRRETSIPLGGLKYFLRSEGHRNMQTIEQKEGLKDKPVPPVCETCYKKYGI
ncbi:radical SAM protein [Candidatus Bipolaricaulota bacterium]|nr:radical SAM protein [Candidatus Bipolaricaulota bacterium]